ncbi:MAG TPA: HEAT repeat domain-containing protein, partial [Planctomycetota bacterium]|nr:HEAT repeat domain-containing protein [Planctomycetota bacterium]
ASSGRLALAAPSVHAPGDDEFAWKVEQILRSEPGLSERALAAALEQLGPRGVPALFVTLGRGALSPLEPLGAPEPLLEPQRRALLSAAKRMPEACRVHAATLAAAEALRAERPAAVVVLGEIGDARDLPLLFALTRPVPEPADPAAPHGQPRESQPLGDDQAAGFQRAVELVLARDPFAYREIESPFLAADNQLQLLAIQAITNVGTLPALELFSRLLGARPQVDQQLLTSLSRVASSHAAPFDGAIADRVRVYLHSSSAESQREAALVAGKLEDVDALPFLIALLGHENRGVRQNAYWSLRKITGLGFKDVPQAWTPWLEQQTQWWRETAPDLFAELASADRPRALSIVQSLARRRFPRHALAAELARALGHQDAEVRRLTCFALAQLRSRAAVPDLVDRFEDPDPEVRKEALRAARAISGLDLPPERAIWEKALR